jgi:uncharacterized protein
MKFLLVLLVVGFGLWTLVSRLRGGSEPAPPPKAADQKPLAPPVVMVRCAHCGLHLPAADASAEGSRLYCSDDHRRLGPAPLPPT